MVTKSASREHPLWIFSVLPPVILNIAAILIFGSYYTLQAVRPALISGISKGQVQFAAYFVIFVVEWLFAILLLRQETGKGRTLTSILSPNGKILKFRWTAALLIFVVFNALFVVYIPLVDAIYGQWPRLDDLNIWQRLFLVLAVPIQAAFCEELIWRGHIIPSLMRRKRSKIAAILLSAISFALIHGVFLLDKLLLTFLLGIVSGFYFVRERNLLPLMISHFIVDVWVFSLSVF